jgi:deoxyadenosine/deoxycytidine kinase
MAKPLVVCIEGGIGVGKSTVIAALEQEFEHNPDVAVLAEPVDEWSRHGFLEAMYDGEVDACAFQHVALISIMTQLENCLLKDRPSLIIMERSPWSNFHVFGKTLTGTAHEMFKYSWLKTVARIEPLVDVRFVYMHAPMATLQERITRRSRDGEESIPEEYMELIHANHEEWLHTIQHKCVYAGAEAQHVYENVSRAIDEWAQALGFQRTDKYCERAHEHSIGRQEIPCN